MTVSLSVASTTSLTNNCRQQAGYRFGTVQPGTPALTATGTGACSFSFDSTNDTAMLRIYQRDQNASPAMASMSGTIVDQDGGVGYDTFTDIDMVDDSNGYAVGDGARLFQTTNGTTWTAVASGLSGSLYAVEAVSASTVLVVGTAGVRRSTTSGTSWTTVHAPGVTLRDIDTAGGGGRYWAVGSSGHIATSPDGISWTAQTSGTTSTLTSVDALSGTMALAAGSSQILRYDGSSWSTRATNVDAGHEVHGLSETGLAIAAGNWGEIRRSTDGGLTWSTGIFGPSPGITDIGVIFRGALVVSSTEAYVSGTRGGLLRSTDSGATWTELVPPTRNFIRTLAANPAGTRFFAVGGGELIADTTDWSAWNVRRRTGSALFDVAAIDAQRAYAVGTHGFIRATSDGSTWTTPSSPTTQHLWAVDATERAVGYAVGDGGTVLRTTNGTAWTAVTPTGAHSLRGVTAVDDDTVVAVGLGGVVARSTNAGASWTITTPVATSLNSISSHGRRVVAVGNAGTAIVSSDRGLTWTDRTAAVATGNPLRDVSLASADVIYAISKYENQSRRSADGGVTWQTWTGIGWGNGGYSVSAVSEEVVFTAIYEAYATRSVDAGATASSYGIWNAGAYVWAVAAVDANTAWVVGEDGAIGRTQQGVTINDYGGTNTWGNAAAPSLFGVCLQSSSGVTNDWTVDASPPCSVSDGDPWRALPSSTTTAKVAHTTSAGAVGTVTVVWGVRPAANTPPGTYQATAQVEVVAPDA